MTTTTMATASPIVLNTSSIEALICSVGIVDDRDRHAFGQASPGSSAASSITAAAVSSGLAAGVGKMPMKVPGLPLKLTIGVVAFGRKFDPRHVAQSHDIAVARRRSGSAPNASGVCSVERTVIE